MAFLMGFAVGFGIKKGNRGRGGRLFQLMAVALTYLAISASLSSLVIKEFISPSDVDVAATEEADAQFPPPFPGTTPTPQVEASPTPETTPHAVATPVAEATPEASSTPLPDAEEIPSDLDLSEVDAEPLSGGELVIGILILMVSSLALPVVAVFLDPITAFFYLLAMYQAASMVKPATPEGPHSLSEMKAEVQSQEEPSAEQ